jgi:uncharacterized protein (TIGR02757 family)
MPNVPPNGLGRHLEALYALSDGGARRDADPVAFVHRYSSPADQEIAGLLASGFAYGRVDLFRPVLARLFDHLDTLGGPRAMVDAPDPLALEPLRPLIYRWNRGSDVIWLLRALHHLLPGGRSVEALFGPPGPVRERLTIAVALLRAGVLAAARSEGHPATTFEELPRGARYLLPSPVQGSACKRLNLYLRWMVRPPTEQVDLGLWTSFEPDQLQIPLDVHVARVARFLGLTSREDTSWRTAEEVTDALRRIDPRDPVRFDFALAHLGISGACLGHRDPVVCPTCPLDAVCTARPPDQRSSSSRSYRAPPT